MNTHELLQSASRNILAWYPRHRRMLPWRENQTPYRVWISEVMLQQTRIEAVIPYYTRFLEKYPDVSALALADDDELLKMWQGLGYYSRAKNLKKAAGTVIAEYGGVFPCEKEDIRKLSGVGDYIAGAVASIAFGKPCSAVDGNVLRVVMRFLDCDDDVTDAKTKKAVQAYLDEIYPSGEDARNLTEGLMELGEHICLPNTLPKCEECPLVSACRGLRAGRVNVLPVRKKAKARKIEERTVFVLHKDGNIVLQKRGAGLLSGLFEFPNTLGHLTEKQAADCLRSLGYEVGNIRKIGSAKHIFTHIEWHMVGYDVTVKASPPDTRFVTPQDMKNTYALPTAFRTYCNYIENFLDC